MPFWKQRTGDPSEPEPYGGMPGEAEMLFGESGPPAPLRLYRQIRRDARRSLFSRWAKAAAGILFLAGIFAAFQLARGLIGWFLGTSGYALSWNRSTGTLTVDSTQLMLDGAVFLLSEWILCPLIIGYLGFIYQLTSGEEPALAAIFEPMQSVRGLLRSFLFGIVMQGMGALAAAVCCLPGGLVLWSVGMLSGSSGMAALLRIALGLLGLALLILGLLLAAAVMTRFIAAPFILAYDDRSGVLAALRLSARATKGFRGELLTMVLSFLPLMLLCILLVPMLFVVPYMAASCALFSRFLLDRLAKVREE